MSRQVTLTLPEETYQQAEWLAHFTESEVADVLASTVELALPPFGQGVALTEAVSELSDAEVVALADLQMKRAEDERLSHLLHRQQAGVLTNEERPELEHLMGVYQQGLFLKAKAPQEAVRRALREPLGS